MTLTGVFENNLCSKAAFLVLRTSHLCSLQSSVPQVGKKTYTNGLVYVGELFEDQAGHDIGTALFGVTTLS